MTHYPSSSVYPFLSGFGFYLFEVIFISSRSTCTVRRFFSYNNMYTILYSNLSVKTSHPEYEVKIFIGNTWKIERLTCFHCEIYNVNK